MTDELQSAVHVGYKALLASKDQRLAELEAWKESALKVMPDFQAIGKALGLKLGEDVSPQILPRIKAMAALLDRAPHAELVADAGYRISGACTTDCPACAWAKLKGDL